MWAVLCTVYCILASVLQGTSLEVSLPPYLPSSDGPPLLLLYLPPLLPLSSARFLPPLFPSLRPCIVPFIPHSFPFSTPHPSYTPAPTLPRTIASSLHPLAPSLHHPPLVTSLPSSVLCRSFRASPPHPIQCTPCVWLASCIE